MFWPCETRTSTCRNFATISSGVYRFFGIAVLLHVKRHSSGRTTSKGEDHRPPDRFVETTQAACEGRTRTAQTLISERNARQAIEGASFVIHGIHGQQIADHSR